MEKSTKKQIFTLTVNYDDPRWHEIREADYTSVGAGLTVERFPLQGSGEQKITVQFVSFKGAVTTKEIISEIRRQGCRLPDRAETEALLQVVPEERENKVFFSLCGSIVKKGRNATIPCLSYFRKCHSLDLVRFDSLWGAPCLLAVRLPKEKVRKTK